MSRRFLGRVIFLRHGQTKYTDVFPDLTDEGIRTIFKSAKIIKESISNDFHVRITTSPMIRAQASASIIAKTIEYQGKIKIEQIIRAAKANDEKLGKALFDEHMAKGGIRALSIACSTDPRFEDANIIEPMSEIRKRFFEYFAILTNNLLSNKNMPLCFICVSHYETLCHIVEQLFELDYQEDEPLGNGEIIDICFFDIGIENTNIVEIEVTFREKTIYKKFFDYEERKIR